ncbi:MAG: hypothetical protein KJO31_07150 [Gammaproteobacteria bacterium]|nr:hypothetical protein [Gammaproteobacteria bacterium]
MSTFEFIAVLLSIIFGLAIANLLSGMLQAFLRRELTGTRLAWSLLVGNILLVNWWVFFQWSDHTDWRFHEFLYLALWATIHYLLAVALYPYKFLTDYSEDLQRKFILITLLVAVALDVGEKIVRGDLFNPWYFPLLAIYLAAFIALPLVVAKPWAMRFSGWTLAISVLVWSVVVRSDLST